MSEVALASIRELAARAPWLAGLKRQRIARALAEVARRLGEPDTCSRSGRYHVLARSTGLSVPMVRWGLETSLKDATEARLLRLAQGLPKRRNWMPVPARLTLTLLAGNVFGAAFRELALPLLWGCPVLAKTSSQDSALPHAFRNTLASVDAELAQACEVRAMTADSVWFEPGILQAAEVVRVFGSDTTVQAVRARLPAHVRLVVHGHGLGAALVPARALTTPAAATRTARALALDVAAYDQRGCMSPHAIVLERGGAVAAFEFVRELGRALARIERTLPRGPLGATALAEQMQWRGVAMARGELHEERTHAVSFEGEAPLRPSCGYRNVGVYSATSLSTALAKLSPLGTHLKCLAIAAPAPARRAIAATLPGPLAPRVCAAGRMQTPALDRLADGEPSWRGMVRWVELG